MNDVDLKPSLMEQKFIHENFHERWNLFHPWNIDHLEKKFGMKSQLFLVVHSITFFIFVIPIYIY